MSTYAGTTGDDTQTGTAADEGFNYSQGGQDSLDGGLGNDTFDMGRAFDAGDHIVGGDGYDTVQLTSDTFGLVVTGAMMSGVEELDLIGGNFSLFIEDDATSGLPFLDIVVSANNAFVDASAVTTGSMIFDVNSKGRTNLIGSAGDDRFLLSSSLTRQMGFHGGPRDDSLLLVNGTDGHFRAAAHTFTGMETIYCEGAVDLTLNDGNIAPGETLLIYAKALEPSSPTCPPGTPVTSLILDGHKEQDGHLKVIGSAVADMITGGHQDDTLRGGAGQDTLTGGHGHDRLLGGSGADVFRYVDVGDSHAGHADLIGDLTTADAIDLVSFDGDSTQAGFQGFTLVTAFSGQAGELTVVYDAIRDVTQIMGDVDGDANADLLIEATGDHTGYDNFLLVA